MDNPFQTMKREMAEMHLRKTPFDVAKDHELTTAITGVLLAVPAERVKALIEQKKAGANPKDQYEARELAIVLFVQEELKRLPQTVSAEEGSVIMREMLREALENHLRR